MWSSGDIIVCNSQQYSTIIDFWVTSAEIPWSFHHMLMKCIKSPWNHPNWLICLNIFQRGWNHQPDGDLTDLTDSRQILDSHGAIINNQGDWDRELIWINHQYGCDYGNKMARENQ